MIYILKYMEYYLRVNHYKRSMLWLDCIDKICMVKFNMKTFC